MMQRRQTHVMTAMLAVISCATMMSLGIALSRAANRTAPIDVGAMAPDFTLEAQDGRTVTLSQARGQAAVVLVFYRGSW